MEQQLKHLVESIEKVVSNIVDDKLDALYSKIDTLSGNVNILNVNVGELLKERDVARHNRQQDDIAFVSMLSDMKNNYDRVISKLAKLEDGYDRVPCMVNPEVYGSALAFKTPYLDTDHKLFLILDSQLKVVFTNDFVLNTLGFTKTEVIGKNWLNQFVSESTKDDVRKMFSDLFRHGVNGHTITNYSIVTKTGEHVEVKWQNTIIRGKDFKNIAIIKVGDIVDGSTKD